MPVARKLWLPILVLMPAVAARRRIIAWALAWGREVRVTTAATTQYDSLGRVVSISYNDGVTPAKTFAYDQSAGSLRIC